MEGATTLCKGFVACAVGGMGSNARTMFMELCKRLQTSLRDYDDAATKSQDWRPGLFSGRPYGTLCRAPSHSAEIPGLASWAIFRASLRDFVPIVVLFERATNVQTPGSAKRATRICPKAASGSLGSASHPTQGPEEGRQRLQALPPRFGAVQDDAPRPGIPCGHAGPHSDKMSIRNLFR